MTKTITYDDPRRWSDIAADYDRWAGAFTSHYARAALSLAGAIGPRIIDVAAGTGALAVAAAEAGAQVLATDISPGMVARVAAKLAAYPGAEAKVMDGQALPLADASFDAGFSVFGIMLFPDWRRGLGELVRVVKPGGRVVVASWTGRDGAGPMVPAMAAFRATFPEVEAPAAPAGMATMRDVAAFAQVMAEAGCADVAVHRVDGAWTAASVDEVMDNVDSMMRFSPLFTALDAEEKGRLMGPLRAAFEGFVTADGSIAIPSTANIAVGRRAA